MPGAEDVNLAGGKEVDSTENRDAASTWGGKTSSTGKDLSVFRDSKSLASLESFHTFPSKFAGSHYFPVSTFTFNSRHSARLRVKSVSITQSITR